MEITINTESYNQRRWSKPWVATVDFSTNAKGEFSFGDWVGNHYKGSSGILVINASEGQIVAKGQKDYRGNSTSMDYYVVLKNGKLDHIGGKPDAYKHHMANKKPNAMKLAWEIRRKAASKFDCKVMEISMGECLKQAWAEIKNA